MAALTISVRDLPAAPLDAATLFYSTIVPAIREDLPEVSEVVVYFELAHHSHSSWRLAAIQELAREASPIRVNAIVGADREKSRELLAFLQAAPGVTGQLLVADGKSREID